MRLITAVALVLALVAAGCIQVPESATLDAASAQDPTARADAAWIQEALVVDHDHGDRAAHELASPTMTELSHTSLDVFGAATLSYGEADLLGEDHAVFAGFLGGGFVIADVSDPADPVAVSFTPDPGMEADVKASKSGNFVFVGRQVGHWMGVQAYNVMVREAPVAAGFFPIAGAAFRGGCHMLAVHGDHLYCAPNDNTVRIMEIVETPGAVALLPAGVYAPQGEPLAHPIANDGSGDMTHDMTVQDDPLTGEPVMYVSFWDYGLRVVDVSDPTDPVELGAWMGEGAEEWGTYFGAIHTAMAGLVDGKRVVVVVPEYAEVPSVTFIDATDYGAMKALGVWAPLSAEQLGDQRSTFSTHNFQFLEGKVYLAMYHGGVWVIDASTPEKLAAPTAAGYFLPHDAREAAAPVSPPGIGGGGSVWDVLVKDGVILATDMGSGVYALQLAEDAGKPLTSFA